MKTDLLIAVLSLPLAGGIGATWLWGRRQARASVSVRLQRFMPQSKLETPRTILKVASSYGSFLESFEGLVGFSWLGTLLSAAAMDHYLVHVLSLTLFLLVVPPVLAYITNLNIVFGLIGGSLLATAPLLAIIMIGENRRSKFCEQLPDAIDLMVAVLRSGHSVSQAVRAVSQEVPKPCGEEFEAILQRMNLGQPLADSLVLSARRFQSYELDLLRRAVSIQSEVGGSLADLLEKTNSTLRQRLKLVRQLKVITAPNRLSANIIGFLPVVLAIGLNFISPGYLGLLTGNKMGQMMLVGVVILEVVGIMVMRRMSTMKV